MAESFTSPEGIKPIMVDTEIKETVMKENGEPNEMSASMTKKIKAEKDKIKIIVSDYDEAEYKQMLDLYEKTFNVIKENELVKGRIVAINGEDVLIDIGSKSDGRVSINDFSDPDEIAIGKDVEVFLEKIEDKEGQLVLSKKKADSMKMWDRIVSAQETGAIVKGKCIRRIKGGFVVDIAGLSAFLPGSQIDTKPIRDYDEYVGKVMDFKVLKVNNVNENIIVSHKLIIEESMKGQREELLNTIQKGMTMKAVVKAITDFGVFVDLGGLDGLIHITDLSWGRINHPSDIVQLDQAIEVSVLEFDPEKQRVYLGLKQLQKHPWMRSRPDSISAIKFRVKLYHLLNTGRSSKLKKESKVLFTSAKCHGHSISPIRLRWFQWGRLWKRRS
ncbi:MAG: S1 RNA-binding domain-containing protein [Ignavibacteria bacterium]|nr:S1 RNA-binding domain-containing protein [Ignavibacteria bacterium]